MKVKIEYINSHKTEICEFSRIPSINEKLYFGDDKLYSILYVIHTPKDSDAEAIIRVKQSKSYEN